MVPRSSVKSPSRAQITLPKVSVKYAKVSQNIRQISLNRSPNFVPDRVLQLVVELEQREVAVAVQLLRRAVVLRYRLRSRSFLARLRRQTQREAAVLTSWTCTRQRMGCAGPSAECSSCCPSTASTTPSTAGCAAMWCRAVAERERTQPCRQPVDPFHCTWGVERRGEISPLPWHRLFLGPGFRLAARWNRLVETVKTRKRRGKTGKKWARYGLKRVNKEGTGGINWSVGDAAHKKRRLQEGVALTG